MNKELASRLQRMTDRNLMDHLARLRMLEQSPPMWAVLLPFVILAIAIAST